MAIQEAPNAPSGAAVQVVTSVDTATVTTGPVGMLPLEAKVFRRMVAAPLLQGSTNNTYAKLWIDSHIFVKVSDCKFFSPNILYSMLLCAYCFGHLY